MKPVVKWDWAKECSLLLAFYSGTQPQDKEAQDRIVEMMQASGYEVNWDTTRYGLFVLLLLSFRYISVP